MTMKQAKALKPGDVVDARSGRESFTVVRVGENFVMCESTSAAGAKKTLAIRPGYLRKRVTTQ